MERLNRAGGCQQRHLPLLKISQLSTQRAVLAHASLNLPTPARVLDQLTREFGRMVLEFLDRGPLSLIAAGRLHHARGRGGGRVREPPEDAR
jgi:hypothetical protein